MKRRSGQLGSWSAKTAEVVTSTRQLGSLHQHARKLRTSRDQVCTPKPFPLSDGCSASDPNLLR